MSGRALAAALALCAAGPVSAGVRQTDASGACLYWSSRSVEYRINPARGGSSASCGPASDPSSGAVAAVEAGFAAWTGAQQACTDLALVRGADTSETRLGFDPCGQNENLVVFRRGWCSENPQAVADPCWTDPSLRCADTYDCFENAPGTRLAGYGTIALTTSTYDEQTGEVYDADMELVDWTGVGAGTTVSGDRQGWYFTCLDPATVGGACTTYGQSGCYSMDLQNTVTHEAGHFVGMAHTTVLDATMYPNAPVGETKKRTLAPDDLSADPSSPGLCAIYPKGAPTLTCVPARATGAATCRKKSGGCASAEGLGVLSLLGLLLAARRDRRQRTTTPA